jgi:NAD(P)-dependent dehydrogenase (short-subunit alcohol dehydrogenase family)
MLQSAKRDTFPTFLFLWERIQHRFTVACMSDVGKFGDEVAPSYDARLPKCAAVFGASGGIGRALVQQLASGGCECIYAGSRSGSADSPDVIPFAFDLTDEASIASAAAMMREKPPEWVIVASGVLTLERGAGPERTYKRIDPEVMARVLAINTIGPALIAKHVLPLMPRSEPFVFAALSARVGSISDNGLGGWHSYRASKAALNMLLKNLAIEMGRTHSEGVVVGLHPGTVDSALSKPFQKGLPKGQLTDPLQAARNLIAVLSQVTPENSGQVFDFAGEPIAP